MYSKDVMRVSMPQKSTCVIMAISKLTVVQFTKHLKNV